MKSGRCPSCGSTAVHSKPNGIGFAQQSPAYNWFDTTVLAEVATTWPRVPSKG